MTLQQAARRLGFPSAAALKAWLRRRRAQFPPRYRVRGHLAVRILTRRDVLAIQAFACGIGRAHPSYERTVETPLW